MDKPDWQGLLKQALTVPGTLSKAYSVFHNYSLGNQLLASFELASRGMPLSPIASFSRWKELGRSVRKGEKAIPLVMPVTLKKKKAEDADAGEESADGGRTIFILKRNWFSLDQTEGEAFKPEVSSPEWDKAKALATLDIKEVPFEMADGNCQGYAKRGVREVAVNPVAAMPWKTLFHEIAHHLLGHTATGDATGVMADGHLMPKCIREAEAEATAYLCCATLGLPGMEESRGYIQNWLDGEEFPDKSARRVFAAADKILKAGSIGLAGRESAHG
ncbi:MAG: ArdC family protein [Pseudomonadota bacterium]